MKIVTVLNKEDVQDAIKLWLQTEKGLAPASDATFSFSRAKEGGDPADSRALVDIQSFSVSVNKCIITGKEKP